MMMEKDFRARRWLGDMNAGKMKMFHIKSLSFTRLVLLSRNAQNREDWLTLTIVGESFQKEFIHTGEEAL